MKRWYFWVGLLVSVGFMYLALKGQNFPELWNTIQSASLSWLIPAVLVYFVDVWARSWRWHYLLRPVQALSTSEVFPIIAMGLMGNNVFPVRAGELLRAVVLKHRYEIPISTSLATILVERVFDGVVMLSFIIFQPECIGQHVVSFRFCRRNPFAGLVGVNRLFGCAGCLSYGSHFSRKRRNCCRLE